MALKHIGHFDNLGDTSVLGMKALGEAPTFHSNVIVHDSFVGSWTELGSNTVMVESTFDDYSYTAGDNQIIYSTIGKFSNIASHVRINPGNHPMERVTLHHMTYRRKLYGFGDDDQQFFEWRRAHRCVIGHDTWLGHNATVMPGVNIGHGAVVGSGAVVTKDVPAYMIAVGVPARVLRPRFPEHIVDALLRIAWWDWDHATLRERIDYFGDPRSFVERFG